MKTLALFLMLSLVTMPLARAGTTGGIAGVVTVAGAGTPIAGAKISVTSPSQNASTTTDARGHFAFVSLAPDEYTISLQKEGYEPLSYAGVAVLADAQQTLTLAMRPAL
ncbi:MAG: carboxypeptidase regulatory-like domain-containing protein, partial [Candidatus Eremiobacteraeota bacterium]|nr:carboxypeptidase regulatory-like domain-containing protein [Candidatus Eremiobacteraeota bacterium]